MNTKILIILSLFIVLISCQAPKPVPLPAFKINNIVGDWNVAFTYSSSYNNNHGLNQSCWTYNFEVSDNSQDIIFVESYTIDGTFNTSSVWFYNVANKPAQWDNSDSHSELVWIGFDLINSTWGLLASQNSQNAVLLTKGTTASSILINSQIALLKAEGYSVNSTNYYTLDNSDC